MASAKPSMPRDGTMQVTAKEGINLLKAAGKDVLLEMQGLKDPEPEKPSVARAGTMQVTAKEGAEFLERDVDKAKEEIPESNNVDDKPVVQRDTTMEATAKEAQGLLAGEKIDPDAATRGQQKKLVKLAEEEDGAPSPKKAKLAKGTTMVNTAKEAKSLLGDKAPDADAQTRGQQKKIEEIQSEKASPKKPKLSKNTTMAATAKEGAALLGDEKLGETRAASKPKQPKEKGLKRYSTIQRTMEEAKYVLEDGVNVNEGRRTRSAGKKPAPVPALKKAGTMQSTAKEGKEFLKRGKKAKKAAPVDYNEDKESEEEAEAEAEEA